jgi:ribose-phosphate pyrophosphokinase
MGSLNRGKVCILACEGGKTLAEKVTSALNHYITDQKEKGETNMSPAVLVDSKEVQFGNTEIKTTLKQSIRGRHVVVIQDIASKLPYDEESGKPKYSINDHFMALISAICTAQQNDANYVTVVVPTLLWDRQDKRFEREAILTAPTANFLKLCGARRVVTMDIHAEAVAGIYAALDIKFENLYAAAPIMDYIRQHFGPLEKLRSMNLDAGGYARAEYYARKLGIPQRSISKARDHTQANVVAGAKLVESLDGTLLIVEDMVDTGGSLDRSLKTVVEYNPEIEGIIVACTKPYLNVKAPQILDGWYEGGKGKLKAVIGTNAVTLQPGFAEKHPWYHEVDVTRLFAEAIYNINTGGSVSRLRG